jgi:Ca2+-binding RTX toxin-like protein
MSAAADGTSRASRRTSGGHEAERSAMPYTFSYAFDQRDFYELYEPGRLQLYPETLGLAGGGFVTAYRFGNGEVRLNFHDFSVSGGPRVTVHEDPPEPFVVDEPSLTQLDNGNIVLVYESVDGAGGYRLHGRIFDPSGTPVGERFELGFTEPHAEVWSPEVVALKGGGFVVSTNQGFTGQSSVYWDRYDDHGVSTGASARVDGPGSKNASAITALADGGFVVVYEEAVQGYDVSAAIYNADGSVRKQHFKVSGAESDPPSLSPDVVALKNGGFAVVYVDRGRPFFEPDKSAIMMRTYDADGDLLTSVKVSSPKPGVIEARPEIGVTPEGLLMVTWELPDGGVWGRFFDADGSALVGDDVDSEFSVEGHVNDASVTGLVGGRFVVAYADTIGSKGFEIVKTATGTEAYDPYEGSGLRERVNALGGDDVINGLGGADTLNGGAGVDVLRGGAGDDALYGGADGDNLSGDAGDDALSGGAGADQLFGGDGSDQLNGGAGRDTLTGGAQNDRYRLEDVTLVLGSGPRGYAFDSVVETADGGADDQIAIVASGVGKARLGRYAIPENVENCFVEGDLRFDVIGNGEDNFIIGNDAANRLVGGAGDDALWAALRPGSPSRGDVLDGGAGDDTLNALGGDGTLIGGAGDDGYTVDSKADVIVETNNAGTDLVISLIDRTLTAHLENLVLFGEAARGIGNELNNMLQGGSYLDGRGGADTMKGGGGDDTYVVDDIGDVVDETTGNGSPTVGVDRVLASVTYRLSAHVEHLTLTGDVDVNGVGNTLANTLRGNAGDNALNAGAGADVMAGGDGDDRYSVDNVGDEVREGVGAGDDLVIASINYALTGNVERLQLGAAAQSGTGNSLGNVIIGGAGANVLNGLLGADTLTGRQGADVFAFSTALGGANIDVIGDFSVRDDTIRLDNEVFGGLTNGALGAAAFRIGAKAADATDRVIYDARSGALLFDVDGVGTVFTAVRFATLSAGLALTEADFVVI